MNRAVYTVALAGYTAVIVALTTLKAFFRIGYLWEPSRQRARELRLVPLDDAFSGSWFKPLFEYGGNLAFFVPLGVLLFVGVRDVRKATLLGLGLSAAVEAAQYVFALGRTDIDDLLFNTLGALLGAAFARWCGPRFFGLWQWLGIAVTAVFVVLVALGPRLGDPEKVVDLAVGHVDELGVVQLVGHLDGVDGAAAVLGQDDVGLAGAGVVAVL